MIKRIFIWLLTIILTFLGNFAFQYFSTPKTELVVQFNTYKTPQLSGIKSISIPRTNINYNIKNPNVIFELGSEDKENFKKYEDYLSSPLIMFAGNHAYHENSGFNVENLDNERAYRKATKDLGTILRAMEQGKTWQDLGMKDTILQGPITLHIPSENNMYHSFVKEMFLVNLEEKITEENIESLLERVDNLINKCVLIEDLEYFLINNVNKKDLEKVLVIAPEFILKNESIYSSNYSDKKSTYMVPVYPTKTVSIDCSIYIKDTIEDKLLDKILEKYSSQKMVSKTGFRTMYSNVDLTNNLDYHIVEDIKIEKLSDSIRNKVLEHETVYESKNENIEDVSNIDNTQKTEENINEETTDEGMPGWVWVLIIIGIICVLILVFMFGVAVGNGY